MRQKVLVFDTSILCVWLEVPGFETCGKEGDQWDYARVSRKIEEEISKNTVFVLPLAVLIETGNHISQSRGDRYELGERFKQLLLDSVDNREPWVAFSEQNTLWNDDKLRELANQFPQLFSQGISIGDATIRDVAGYYAKLGHPVKIFTGDEGLKAYEPDVKTLTPRRRK